MSSLDHLRSRHYAKAGVAQRVADEGSIAFKMHYVGSGSVTSVTVAATTITTVTSAATTVFTITGTTVASLKALIEKAGEFEVNVVDALLSDSSTDNFLSAGALSATTDDFGTVCYEVKWDTAGSDIYTVALTPFRNFNVIRKGQGHRVHLQSIDAIATIAGTPAIKVYQRVGSVEKLVWQAPYTSTVLSQITFAGGHGKISSPDCGELIVRVVGAAVTPASTSYVQLVGEME